MTRAQPAEYRQFLDGVARAMTEEDDIWQFQMLAGRSTLVAHAADDEVVVALIDAGSLDVTVTVDDIVRVADLAVQVGTTAASEGRPAAFVCSRRTPTEEAVKAAYLRKLRILSVHPTGEDSWGYDIATLSHQKFTRPPNAPTLSEQQWSVIHDGIYGAVFYDAQQTPIASFAGLCAVLNWQEKTGVVSWGSRHFDLPAGTLMLVPGQPPLPVVGVTLQFHKETRPLRGTREESAVADLVTDWLWG
ncbi:hypothetical protein ACIBI9_62850 [Nonomuraea sp. NPDC050451]|uniref:hypothetical protein n=1 Tax=Nonomuraea sp. NPDC050451 TaxID=3364364 RepID=UPI0037BA617E